MSPVNHLGFDFVFTMLVQCLGTVVNRSSEFKNLQPNLTDLLVVLANGPGVTSISLPFTSGSSVSAISAPSSSFREHTPSARILTDSFFKIGTFQSHSRNCNGLVGVTGFPPVRYWNTLLWHLIVARLGLRSGTDVPLHVCPIPRFPVNCITRSRKSPWMATIRSLKISRVIPDAMVARTDKICDTHAGAM